MFGQVLDKVSSYFGPGFLVARYFPWLICVAVNVAIACIEFPAVRAFIVQEYNALAGSKALDLAIALIGIAIVAYAMGPFIQAVTAFLEGAWIPDWMAQFLIPMHAWRREKMEMEFKSRFKDRSKIPSTKAVRDGWKRDRATGGKLHAIDDRPAIRKAERLVDEIRAKRWLNLPVRLADFSTAADALSAALKSNCADESMLRNPDDREAADNLAFLHDEMSRVLAPYALEIAKQLENRAQVERQLRFARDELAPTRLGNDAAALRSYCETRYGIPFDLFWPRFLLVIRKDATANDAIAAAKVQLDFSILALALTTATILSWFSVIWLIGHSMWTVLFVFVFGPLAIAAWLKIVHASYAAFASLARSAVDLFRFDVLEALRRPLPVSTGDEERIWVAFTKFALLDEQQTNVTFRHPTK